MSELADSYRNGKSSQRPYGDWVSLRIWGRGVGVAGVNSDTPLFAILRKLVPRGTVNAMNRERLVKAAGICELGGSNRSRVTDPGREHLARQTPHVHPRDMTSPPRLPPSDVRVDRLDLQFLQQLGS